MIDHGKRKTLKWLGGSALGLTTLASMPAVATQLNADAGLLESGTTDVDSLPELSHIRVESRLSSISNDLEIVLTNTGSQQVSLTQITPSVITTPRGQFDLGAALAPERSTLAVGDRVCIPLQRRSLALNHPTVTQRNQPLAQTLRERLSIVTDHDAFAALSFVATPLMV